ncbi:MAG TPA: hypothetical protein DIW47_01180 [Bacteroidetes bacterium]|nr:hypothetical protein [Bacteroidota bacterium]
MLLPLFGFIFGIIVSSTVAAIVLYLHPRWQVNFRNIGIFVIGSFAGAIISGFIFTLLIANESGQLESTFQIISFFVSLILGTTLGGTLATVISHKLGFNKLGRFDA